LIIAIDTETEMDEPWSIQWATEPHKAAMVLTGGNFQQSPTYGWLKSTMASRDNLTVVHNAMFDVRVLNKVGIYPSRVADTMVMAYILGLNSRGLKNLAYRYLNMHMDSYSSIVAEASRKKALVYLQRVLVTTWSDPMPVLEILLDGTNHVKWPQNISTKVKKLLKKYDEGPKIDLRERWSAMDGKEEVENAFGKMESGYLSDIDRNIAVDYACRDADATLQIYSILWPMVRDQGLEEVFEIDMGIVPVVTEMMDNGVLIDCGYMERLEDTLNVGALKVQAQINQLAGHYVNPGSPKQVAGVLYELGIFKSNKQSTGAEVLDVLSHKHEIVRAIQDHRALQKLITTYARVLPRSVDCTGRIHTTYSTTRTASGRLASSEPNLQNIPSRSANGRLIREGFVARPGCKLLAIDYSQIELRVAAHESQDAEMLKVYLDGGDIHETTRFKMYGGPPDEIQRKPAKTVNFSVIYCVTPPGLLDAMYHAGVVDVSIIDCEQWIRDFYSLYHGYADYVNELKARVRREMIVADMFGRKRWIPEICSTHERIREEGLRAAVNHGIQSAAGGILKIAMADMEPVIDTWTDEGFILDPLMQVHDELIFEVEDDILELVAGQLVAVMESAYKLSVPILAEPKVGEDWNNMEELKLEVVA